MRSDTNSMPNEHPVNWSTSTQNIATMSTPPQNPAKLSMPSQIPATLCVTPQIPDSLSMPPLATVNIPPENHVRVPMSEDYKSKSVGPVVQQSCDTKTSGDKNVNDFILICSSC